MKRDKFLSAMSDIDEQYIAEYEKAEKARKRRLITRVTAIAASVCLVIGAAVSLPVMMRDKVDEGAPLLQNTDPQVTESAPPVEDKQPEPQGPFRLLSVKAEKTDGAFVSCDSDFIVEAENATADLVREHVYISGGPEYTVTEEDGSYRVSLKSSLSSGSVVSLSYVNDGITEYSWAFETVGELEIVGHTPGKDEYSVDTDTVVELTLSMVGGEDFADYVTLTPKVDGRWECLGKVIRFIPYDLLPDDTNFTVTVAPGYTVDGYVMEQGYSFRFSTGREERISQITSPNYGGMLYYRTGEKVIIDSESISDTFPENAYVRLYSFADAEDAVAKVEGRDAELTLIYEKSLTQDLIDEETGNMIFDPMEEGYYLIELDYSYAYAYKVHAVVCVHHISAYAFTCERDIVVWADDEGIPVRYGDMEEITDENCIVILKDASDGSGDAGYLYLGAPEAPLVVAVPNYETEVGYPNAYLYTDKPIYKTDDTVSFWGAVPMGLIYGEGGGEFTVKLSAGGGWISSVTVTPDGDGTVHGEFTFTDITEGCGYVSLYYNETYLYGRGFDIEDYYLQNYTYETVCENRYVTKDSPLEFSVAVTHISGISVSGKRLRAEAGGESYYSVTDGSGVARFSIPYTEEAVNIFGSGVNQISSASLSVYSGDTEEGETAYESICSLSYYVIRSGTEIERSYDSGKLYTYKGVYLRPELADGKEGLNYREFYEYGACFKGTVTVMLTAETRQVESVTVDPYTGKQLVSYTDVTATEQELYRESLASVTEYTFDPSGFSLPEATELSRYAIRMFYSFELEDGTFDKGEVYLCGNQFEQRTSQSSAEPKENVGIEVYSNDDRFGGVKYDLYRYALRGDMRDIAAGEEVKLALYDSVNDTEVQQGYILRILYRNGVISTDLLPADRASFTYEEELGPCVKVAGAYHLNGRFYRLPSYLVTQDTDERTVTVTHQTDKESYAPGDTVTLTVKTTDHKGEPIACSVNVSVVNEAVFTGRSHFTGIVSELLYDYGSKYPAYSFSTYYDSELYYFSGGMGGGGGDESRVNFADTACFETVTTDESGVATVTFTLPDSVTEYRITTHAAAGDMRYGVTESNFSVKMDFFLQSNAPRGQKYTDDYVAYATTVSGLSGQVDFIFTLKETDQQFSASAPAGAAASVNFGKLPVGTYTLRVEAALGEFKDSIEYPVEVVAGSMIGAYTEQLTQGQPLTVTPSSFPVKVEIYTEAAERYLDYFAFLRGLPRTRLDTAITSVRADRLYNQLLERESGESYLKINEEFISEGLLSMYADGGGDVVLTALSGYYMPEYYSCTAAPSADSADGYLRSLLLCASAGRCTISELRAAQSYAEDEEHIAIIGLCYAFLGDYDNAKQMYAALPERSDIRGADALRALLATFVDRENATLIIETLIEEESDEFYLGFALISYIQQRISVIEEDHTVTLTVNGMVSEHTVNGLQTKEVFFENDGTSALTLSYTGDEKTGVSVTYNDHERLTETDSFYAWLEGDVSKYGTAYLMIDISGYSGRKELSVALPPSLRVSGSVSGEGVYGSAKHEHVSIVTSQSFRGVVSIPLLVTQSGNYTLEPIRLLTEAGNSYYSNEIVFVSD